MQNVIVSKQAIEFVNSQKHILNPIIVIYRDIAKFGCWYSAKPISFVPRAKVIDEKKINEYFTMFNNSYDIRIWVETALFFFLVQIKWKSYTYYSENWPLEGTKIGDRLRDT